jgi:hypothetical protein
MNSYDWFNVNLLLLNFKKKTGFIHFKTKNANEINGKLQYKTKFIANSSDTKFLGLCFNNTMAWRVHIDHRKPKLGSS